MTDLTSIVIPPPYMDPAHSKAKKAFLKDRQESVKLLKQCDHCGAPPQAQIFNLPNDRGLVWPAARPDNSIHQEARKLIGYVLLIAAVVCLTLIAFKCLP